MASVGTHFVAVHALLQRESAGLHSTCGAFVPHPILIVVKPLETTTVMRSVVGMIGSNGIRTVTFNC